MRRSMLATTQTKADDLYSGERQCDREWMDLVVYKECFC